MFLILNPSYTNLGRGLLLPQSPRYLRLRREILSVRTGEWPHGRVIQDSPASNMELDGGPVDDRNTGTSSAFGFSPNRRQL